MAALCHKVLRGLISIWHPPYLPRCKMAAGVLAITSEFQIAGWRKSKMAPSLILKEISQVPDNFIVLGLIRAMPSYKGGWTCSPLTW